jgi:hypothetical protein
MRPPVGSSTFFRLTGLHAELGIGVKVLPMRPTETMA